MPKQKKLNPNEPYFNYIDEVTHKNLELDKVSSSFYTPKLWYECVLVKWESEITVFHRVYCARVNSTSGLIEYQYYKTIRYPKRYHIGGPLHGQTKAHVKYGEDGYISANLDILNSRFVDQKIKKTVYVYIVEYAQLKEIPIAK